MAETKKIVEKCFQDCSEYYKEEGHQGNIAYAVIKALANLIKNSTEKTYLGLLDELDHAYEYLIKKTNETGLQGGKTVLSLKAALAIYRSMVRKEFSLAQNEDIRIIKEVIIDKSNFLSQHSLNSKNRIAQYSKTLLRNGLTILIHGYSSVAVHAMLKAAMRGVQFKVIVTESQPNGTGALVKKILDQNHIPVKLITDSTIALAMQEVDCIFVGCEAVVENGGIISKLGTYTVALCAKTFQKPFYVFTESLKFIKEFPISQLQYDVQKLVSKDRLDLENVQIDYTPPEYITLLFTDIGIFTPSAVSDELIQFFSS